jgi:hypothetical protein
MANLLRKAQGGSQCSVCGCAGNEHETEQEAGVREAGQQRRQERSLQQRRRQEEESKRQAAEQQRQQGQRQHLQRQRQPLQEQRLRANSPAAGAKAQPVAVADSSAEPPLPPPLPSALPNERQRRVLAAAERRAEAERLGDRLQESDCDVMLHSKRSACDDCKACPGFRILFRWVPGRWEGVAGDGTDGTAVGTVLCCQGHA